MDWVKLDCPRCKTVSPIPASQAGQYVLCPGCQKSVMAPLHAPAASPPIDQVAAPAPVSRSASLPQPRAPIAQTTPPPIPAPAPPPTIGARSNGPRPAASANGSSAATAVPNMPVSGQLPTAMPPNAPPIVAGFNGVIAPPLPAPPLAAPPSTKVARFLTADLIPSTVSLAADGQLPKLALTDTAKPVEERSEGSSLNPLVLFAAVAISLCMSVVLLMTDLGGGADDEEGARLRQQLTVYYQGAREPLAAYQVELREAQQAYSRGQPSVAQAHYRKVLDMLRAEGGSRFRGLTGAPARDKNLEELLSRLLGQGYSPPPVEEP